MKLGRRNLAIIGLVAAAVVATVAGVLGVRLVASAHDAPRATPIADAKSGFSAGDHIYSVEAGGRERDFTLHVPPGISASDRPAFVAVFHGAGGTAAATEKLTRLDADADAGHYVVAYLDGYAGSWNDLAGHSAAQAAGVDDVAFATAVVSNVERLHPIDTTRVVALGFSNGGLFADLLGCRLPQTFRTIVTLEGSLPVAMGRSCAPSAPVSVFDVEGTKDPTVPYNGGSFTGVSGTTAVMSAPAAVARWAQLDGCSSAQSVTRLDAGTQLRAYTGCPNGVDVSLRVIDGGKHAWPAPGELDQVVTQALAVRP